MNTFAFPYMNGPLHMGHLYTIMKAELATRYQETEESETCLFPFGFHCTGMPIYGAAQKLSRGDAKVRQMLLDVGVLPDDISKFYDPNYWITYFPERAMADLQGLGLAVDLSTAFITTEKNPYFDSFVRWQYEKLRPLIKFEARQCIYCKEDAQPCADHDRQTGEGVKPKAFSLKIREGRFEVEGAGSGSGSGLGPSTLPVCIVYGHETWHGIISQYGYDNLVAQRIQISLEPEGQSASADCTLPFQIYLPESPVVSRSGHRCIVALTDQWYIKYSDEAWKERTRQALAAMTVHDKETLKQLHIAVDNMDDWCISREFGLGTRVPWDPKFVIDSLSDSTIYMAYYAVKPFLHEDLCGQRPLKPLAECDTAFWDYVMLGQGGPGGPGQAQDQDIRAAFLKHYPVNIRVSGKDLIYNHLIMSLYHHVAIWGPEMCPREYRVNGHARIDGEKMSKSTGNFIAIKDIATRGYDIDTVKVMLTEAGDGLNDANLRLQDHDITKRAVQSTLARFSEPRPQQYDSMPRPSDVLDLCLWHALHSCFRNMSVSFKTGRFREGLVEGWRKATNTYERYLKDCQQLGRRPDPALHTLFTIIQRYALTPVLGAKRTGYGRAERDYLAALEGTEVETVDTDTYARALDYFRDILALKTSSEAGVIAVPNRVLNSRSWPIIESLRALFGHKVPVEADTFPLDFRRDPFKVKPKIRVLTCV